MVNSPKSDKKYYSKKYYCLIEPHDQQIDTSLQLQNFIKDNYKKYYEDDQTVYKEEINFNISSLSTVKYLITINIRSKSPIKYNYKTLFNDISDKYKCMVKGGNINSSSNIFTKFKFTPNETIILIEIFKNKKIEDDNLDDDLMNIISENSNNQQPKINKHKIMINNNNKEIVKKLTAVKQCFKCANCPESKILSYKCPFWSYNNGYLDGDIYELDFINGKEEYRDDNLRVLCYCCYNLLKNVLNN